MVHVKRLHNQLWNYLYNVNKPILRQELAIYCNLRSVKVKKAKTNSRTKISALLENSVLSYTIKSCYCVCACTWWACLAKRFNAPASADGLNFIDKRVDQGCWLRSGLESPWGRLFVSLFQDLIS